MFPGQNDDSSKYVKLYLNLQLGFFLNIVSFIHEKGGNKKRKQ